MANHLETSKIVKPVFIVGSGRSGTTLIYKLFASHKSFTWFSNWTTRIPFFPQLSLFSRVYGKVSTPLLTNRKLWPNPDMEGIGVYKYCGFYDLVWEKGRALDENDVSPEIAEKFKVLIKKHQKYHAKDRFINKNVMNSMKILYLKAIFPDAKFIHVVRDGRSVALSLYHVAFWRNLDLWWTDYTPNSWEAEGKDPLLLCGLHWQKEINAITDASRHLPSEQFFCVRYEDFVKQPIHWLKEMVAFSDLNWDPGLEEAVERKKIKNLNSRWQTTVSQESQELVEAAIKNTLQEFNYI